jgi:lipopolysaccharide transport system ATP-binding protein
MSNPVITVENLSKSYILKHQNAERYTALRDVITNTAKSIFTKQTINNNSKEEFWALKDISFEINQGDRVGIIGRNGAGKSTLLKVLSRIVTPTKGRITIDGRIASLLEVGTGFHPELSGRENIFLNGSILGMSKSEIQKKFDEIVTFSEVERFLDTPVKRYSSGMYVRLAFAVAAHLDPEILIVDEVLAVGDAEFQKKCLGKLKDVSGEGRTILFVSHNMEAIQKLCNKGILLNKGSLTSIGEMNGVINSYLDAKDFSQSIFEIALSPEFQKMPGYIYKIQIENENNQLISEISIGKTWQIRIFFTLNEDVDQFVIGLGLVSSLGMPIRTSWSNSDFFKKGNYEVIFKNNDIFFATGIYKLTVGLSKKQQAFHYVEDAANITVSDVSSITENKRVLNTQSGLVLNPMEIEIITK